jgi:predicted nucleic acid-binding protein
MTTNPRWVVDSSVWQRLPRSLEIRQALAARAERGELCLVAPVILEIGFSARDAREWEEVMEQVAGFTELTLTARTSQTARRLQQALWQNGLVRAVGVFDTLTAAVALEHYATVLHYDRDFEHLATAYPEFHQEWAVPPGSID